MSYHVVSVLDISKLLCNFLTCTRLGDRIECQVPCEAWANIGPSPQRGKKRFPKLQYTFEVCQECHFSVCACFVLCLHVLPTRYLCSISDCQISIYKISQSLFGLLFFESWGLFVYILYLVRVSFQRQFNLLLCYINEFEGDLKRCRGTLCEVLADFKCYKELCSLHTVLLLPLYVYSIVANVTLNYLISESCLTKFPKSLNVQEHIMILSWSEISVAFVLYTFALGGFRVEYIWENFYENLLYLRSGNNSKFWEELLCGWKDLNESI
ncbi:hypothetical protein BSL78_20725 [Apostichopus japonicus]|uniref:Uncharacterized protein n=1 Tax=Stichopus japonicus TaxID=307972 RepID=A0A2G8K398_STIJA|nr:hypothetical protein BSL78_20725 [Apostichopus japonicus]